MVSGQEHPSDFEVLMAHAGQAEEVAGKSREIVIALAQRLDAMGKGGIAEQRNSRAAE